MSHLYWQRGPGSPDIEAFRLLIRSNLTPAYAGITNLAAISSGCIRIFIETTHRVIRHALLASYSLLLQEKRIPVDIQHEAIKEESHQRFTQELRASISALTDDRSIQEATIKLLVFLLKEFSRSLSRSDWGVHCFELQDMLSPTDDKVVAESFNVLERLGLITPADGGAVTLEPGTKYVVSRMFAPHYLLPPLEEGCISVSADNLRHAVDPNHPWKGSSKEASLDLVNTLECFYATGFRASWENSLRGHLKAEVFPKYHLNYSDGEDYHSNSQQIGRSVGGLLQRAQFFVAEITDQNENVCYEMGLGIALGKWFCRIKNTMQKVSAPDTVIDELLRSLKHDTYQYDPDVKTEDGRINMLRSVDQVIGQIASRFRKLKPKDREKVNPFEKDRPLHLMDSSPYTNLFMWADQSERMFSWISDFSRTVMEELKLLVYVDPGPSYKGPMALKYLEGIARSTHCVIDITNKNKFGAFLLGYAVGRKRYHLAVWRRGTDSMITSYRGEAGQGEYGSKQELLILIRTFLQSGQEVA